jgi:hypothetical protein
MSVDTDVCFCVVYLTMPSVAQIIRITLDDGMNNELERLWKGTVMA